MTRLFGAAAVPVLAVAAATSAFAQAPQPSAEPSTPLFLRLGPVGVRPSLIRRDVGYDSNVLNEPDESDDFIATIGTRLDVGVKAPRVQVSSSSLYEYLHVPSFDAERGSNQGTDGRMDRLLGRLQPYRDSVRTVGAGMGYRLADESRVGINFDYGRRSSRTDEREYSRGRLYATLAYGF